MKNLIFAISILGVVACSPGEPQAPAHVETPIIHDVDTISIDTVQPMEYKGDSVGLTLSVLSSTIFVDDLKRATPLSIQQAINGGANVTFTVKNDTLTYLRINGNEFIGGKTPNQPKPTYKKITETKVKVLAGCNLTILSRKFNISITDLMEINNLKSTGLKEGQILKICKCGS